MSDQLHFPPVLRRFWLGLVGMTALSLLFTALMTWRLHPNVPYGMELLYGRDFGWDFLVYQHRFSMFRTSAFWTPLEYPLTYPALLGIVFAGLYKLAHPLRDYLALVVASLLAWAAWLARSLAAQGASTWRAWGFALTTLLMLWPAWLEIDTANIEGIVALTLALGLIALAQQRWWLAGILIALAGAMKLFPLLLLAVLLSRRRYKELACSVAIAILATLCSLAVLGPTIGEAQHQLNRGFDLLTNNFGLRLVPDALDANHSLYVVVKDAVVLVHHRRLMPGLNEAEQATLLSTPYRVYLVSTAVLGLALYFLRIRKLPMLNQMLALALCAVLIPPVSMDYTLLHLLVPFGLFCTLIVRRWRQGLHIPGATSCLTCFAVIFTADTYFSLKFHLTCQARSLTLLLLLILVLRYPFTWSELDEPPASLAESAP